MSLLKLGFQALLQEHGKAWTFGATRFNAVCADGGAGVIADIDGSLDLRTLRLFSGELGTLPKEGEHVSDENGKMFFVRRARKIDDLFTEIEING